MRHSHVILKKNGAQHGSRANDHTCHGLCLRTARAMYGRGSLLTLGKEMIRDRKSLLIGLAAGLVVSCGIFYLLSARYKVTSSGPQGMMTIRTDSWTGRTWMARYYKVDSGATTWYWELMEERK